MAKIFNFEVLAEEKDIQERIYSKRKADETWRPIVFLKNQNNCTRNDWKEYAKNLPDNDSNIYAIDMGMQKKKMRHVEVIELSSEDRKGVTYFIERLDTNDKMLLGTDFTYQEALAKAKEISLENDINLIMGIIFPNSNKIMLCEIDCTTRGIRDKLTENEKIININKYIVVGKELEQ